MKNRLLCKKIENNEGLKQHYHDFHSFHSVDSSNYFFQKLFKEKRNSFTPK